MTAAEYSDIAAGYVRGDDGNYTLYLYFQDPKGDILEYSRLNSESEWRKTNMIVDGAKGTGLAFVYRKTLISSSPLLVYQNIKHELVLWLRSAL